MTKKVTILILLIVLISVMSQAESIPVERSFYLYRKSDIADAAMGNTGFIFTTKNSIDTNPAAMANLDKAYYYLGYSHSDYEDGIDISESKNYKTINYFGVSSPNGGFYYRRFKKNGSDSGRSFKFISNEIGIASASKESENSGLSIGGTLKLFINELDDAKITDGTNIKLKREIGYGYGLDLGLLYKSGILSVALNGENLLGTIYWDRYDNVYIHSDIKAGAGVELGVLKYGMSAERVLKKGTATKYGQGLEVTMFTIPSTTSTIFKGCSLKMRAGILSEKFMSSKNSTKSYGMELSRGNFYMDMLTESGNINIFSGDDNKIYKIAIGAAY